MKNWKLLSGAASLAVCGFLAYLFIGGSLSPFTASGTGGLVLAAALAIGGVTSIATRQGKRGGSIAMAVLYGVGGVVAMVLGWRDWSLCACAGWSLLCMIVAMVDIGSYKKPEPSVSLHEFAPMDAPRRRGPATLQEVVTERDPRRRNAAIDELPDKVAKTYLKQTLNIFVDHQGEDENESLVHALIVVLAVVGLLVVVIVAVGLFASVNGNSKTASTPPPAETSRVEQSDSPRESEEPEDTPEPSPEDEGPTSVSIPGSGTLGESFVEIGDAFITDDYQGNPAVVVTYTWINKSGETTNALSELVEQAFQNGVELTAATIISSQRYEPGTTLLNVRPGASTEIQCAFHLNSTTSPIEFEVSEYLSRTSTLVYKSFDLASLEVEGEEAQDEEAPGEEGGPGPEE